MTELTADELKIDLPAALAETETAIKTLDAMGHAVPEEAYQIRSTMRRAIAAESQLSAAQDENAELQATIGKAAGSLRNKLDAALANYPAAKEESLESIIVGMIERGCIHRNGKALNAVDDREIMRHMREEVGELDQACDIGPENILEESADVLGVLIHLVRHYGFTMAQVEQQEIKKLKERFTEPAAPPAALAREGTKS